ncbi:MAG: hypothetical protein VB089_11845 [Anaerolineaceae bacterium]|nr:hypothetical protein [Anaerolineaceae bacterium]
MPMPDLNDKHIDVEVLAGQARENDALLTALLEGISPRTKANVLRYNCYRALLALAGQCPGRLLPYWDTLVELLASQHSSSRFNAMRLLAALAPAVETARLAAIFEALYALLDDPAISVAGNLAAVSGQLALAHPALRERITARLLDLDATHFDPERIDLLKSYAIQSFDLYFADSPDQGAILAFMDRQRDSRSPKTRKLAGEFLKKWFPA